MEFEGNQSTSQLEEAGRKDFNSYPPCIASYRYSSKTHNDLSFNQGEILYVIDNKSFGSIILLLLYSVQH